MRKSSFFGFILVFVILVANYCFATPVVVSPRPFPIPEHYNYDYQWRSWHHVVLEKGWHTDSKGKYYAKGDGQIYKNGWYWIDGKNYYFDYNGYVYRNQWIKDNNTGSWYFVDTDGATVTGWQKIDNVWYYFNPERENLYGVMARNTVMYINDFTFGCGLFAFNNEGAVITNSWYGGHYYGSNGVRMD